VVTQSFQARQSKFGNLLDPVQKQGRPVPNQRNRQAERLRNTRKSEISLPCVASARVQNCDLLPDLLAQIRGQRLDLVHGVDHNRIGQVLRIERRELAGQ
jgi:hypothetical protein